MRKIAGSSSLSTSPSRISDSLSLVPLMVYKLRKRIATQVILIQVVQASSVSLRDNLFTYSHPLLLQYSIISSIPIVSLGTRMYLQVLLRKGCKKVISSLAKR